jgi:hypothetical protein
MPKVTELEMPELGPKPQTLEQRKTLIAPPPRPRISQGLARALVSLLHFFPGQE